MLTHDHDDNSSLFPDHKLSLAIFTFFSVEVTCTEPD